MQGNAMLLTLAAVTEWTTKAIAAQLILGCLAKVVLGNIIILDYWLAEQEKVCAIVSTSWYLD